MPLEYALQYKNLDKFTYANPWKVPKGSLAQLNAPLGVDELPNQKIRRAKQKSWVFNIMVVGRSGLGKSTFINTLFNSPLNDRIQRNLEESSTVNITPHTYELSENGITLLLTVVDTPGFGDSLNMEHDADSIIEYIDTQFDNYLKVENSESIARVSNWDRRIHALLYFLPSARNISQLDIGFMKKISSKVNLIPVISKADSFVASELAEYKNKILQLLKENEISTYPSSFNQTDIPETILNSIPFSVIGSNSFVESSRTGASVRGRVYRWGKIEVENEEHCDFVHLRSLLIENNMQDLVDTTHSIHYSNYRANKISSPDRPASFLACDDEYESHVESAKRSMATDMQRKEDEMRQMFVAKVREKEASLREREEALLMKRQALMDDLDKIRKNLGIEEAQYNEMVARARLNRK